MTTPEPGQRGVIRALIRSQHPIGHVLNQPPFDPPRRTPSTPVSNVESCARDSWRAELTYTGH